MTSSLKTFLAGKKQIFCLARRSYVPKATWLANPSPASA